MIEGGCLCGKVRYTFDGEIEEIVMCHCSQCRKAQGGAFATNSPLDNNKLTFKGSEHIKIYLSSGDKVRAFCSHCGSPLYSAKQSLPDIKRVRLGTVDTDFLCKNQYHIFTDSKAGWHEITDASKQFKKQKKHE